MSNTSPVSSSPSSDSAAPAWGPRLKKKANTVGALRRHFKTASNALSSWQRPKAVHANTYSAGDTQRSPDLAVGPDTAELSEVEDIVLTALSPVESPEEMPPTPEPDVPQHQEGEQVARTEKGKGKEVECLVVEPPRLVVHEEPPTPISPISPSMATADVHVPPLLVNGVPMFKVTLKKKKQYFFKLDPDQGQIMWFSKKRRIIPIENIREIRSGSEGRYYREQFQLASLYEQRWMTIVYTLDGEFKTIHLVALDNETFQMWDKSVRQLYDVRKRLMSGLGHGAIREALWEKQFWKGADGQHDSKLEFEEVVRLCRRLNIMPSRDDLLRRFKQADSRHRGYLDFDDFRKFVASLKARPDIERLFLKIISTYHCQEGLIDYATFVSFMRDEQHSTFSDEALQRLFVKYACLSENESKPSSIVPPSSPARNPLELAMQSAAITASISPQASKDNAEQPQPSTSESKLTVVPSRSPPPERPTYDKAVWTCKAFTSFLLSPENSASRDEKMDMTRPLSEYFISSSHNTYLVGHQLVGESTIEGYVRALLQGCRSVEVDIYDGEIEPVIYHGKTLTSKVSLRDICEAIHRYAFFTSPYPVIISAENHCSVPQQVLIAEIMWETFGDMLIRVPVGTHPKIEVLPSPEDLKYKVLLKTKNLLLSPHETGQDKDAILDTESSSTETSASDSDMREEIRQEWRKARENEAEAIKGFKSELSKAKMVLQRVKPRRGSDNPATRPAMPIPSSSQAAAALTAAAAVAQSVTPPASRMEPVKIKMAPALAALLVYTVGVKCRGINKKEVYAPEHMFSLSENAANRMLKQNMMDLIKHNKTHLVRMYPKGTRIGSTNYLPHRYWSAGIQLVALNWQTFDLGHLINHAMFQRNSRLGYVLKPPPLRVADKQILGRRIKHSFDVTIISAQQLPRRKDANGQEIIDKSIVDPYVEVSLHIPDWPCPQSTPPPVDERSFSPPPSSPNIASAIPARSVSMRTMVVKNNGWNPMWEQKFSIPFDCVADMLDLVFVKFAVKQEDEDGEIAVYCCSMGSLNSGYRHLPLHDDQLSQYLFSTLFVKTNVRRA